MKKKVGDRVHPRYRGIAEHEVKDIARSGPIVWLDPVLHGHVNYEPTLLLLESIPDRRKEFWFPWWIATPKTREQRFGGPSAIFEEDTLLDVLIQAVEKGFFSKAFLQNLGNEIQNRLKK